MDKDQLKSFLSSFGAQLGIISFVGVAGFGIFNWLFMTPGWLSAHNTTSAQVFSTFWSLLGGIMILLCIFHFDAIESKPRAVLIALLGAGLGWLIGMYISPRNTLEQQEFATYKGALVGVLSGYVIGKLQSFINDKFKTPEDFTVRRQAYAAVFVISALLTIGAIYNVRAYGVSYVRVTTNDPRLKPSAAKSNQGNSSQGNPNQSNPDQKNATGPGSDQEISLKCDGSDAPIMFLAESSLPNDSSVTWQAISPDPADPKKVGGSFDDPQFGLFKVGEHCEGTTYIMARSNQDPTVSGQYVLNIKKAPAKPKQETDSTTTQQQKAPDSPPPTVTKTESSTASGGAAAPAAKPNAPPPPAQAPK
jgi:hypothetical protein